MIDASCPKCKASFQVGDEFLGLTVQCGSCGGDFTVTSDHAAPPAAGAMLEIVCPGCQTRHQIPAEARGAEAECMICQIVFRIPESGVQGIAVSPSPASPAKPPVPAAAPSPFPSPMSAAVPKPAPAQANASGIKPGMPGGIDYKNTSTIRLTRSSLFSGGGTGKSATPFGSGLIPQVPPSGTVAPAAAAKAPPPPVPAAPAPEPAAPAAAPTPAAPPPPAPAGKRGGATPPRPDTGRVPVVKPSARAASPVLLGKAMAAGVQMESGETLVDVKEIAGNTELPWMNLGLALAPVLMIPVFVMLAPSLGTPLCAGIGTIIGLACWLGIVYRHMTAPRGKVCMAVTDKRAILAGPESKQETRF